MMSDTKKPAAEDNLGLVHLCANRFRGHGIEYDDLYSAGCIGLLKAVKAFDSGRGVKFSTYAVPVILGEIKRRFCPRQPQSEGAFSPSSENVRGIPAA